MDSLPYFPVSPHDLPSAEEDTSVSRRRRLLSRFHYQILPSHLPLPDLLLQHSVNRDHLRSEGTRMNREFRLLSLRDQFQRYHR